MSHVVTYKFTSLFTGALIAELPVGDVSFTLGLNQAGPGKGSLNVEDPLIRSADWLVATSVNRATVWVDIDGSIAHGGILQSQEYDMSKPTVPIGWTEHFGYLTQRLQAQDYGTLWASSPAWTADIVSRVITDALNASSYSVPMTVSSPTDAQMTALVEGYGYVVADAQIPFSAPFSQRLTVGMIVNEMTNMGWLVGCDIAHDPVYVGGVPMQVLTISYPQRGAVPPAQLLTMDIGAALGMTYSVKGDQQADGVVEMLSGTGGVSSEAVNEFALEAGYPLLEAVASHSSMSSVAIPNAVVETFLIGDLAVRSYPLSTMTLTYPLFDDAGLGQYPSWGNWKVGDEVYVRLDPSPSVPVNPRFPAGLPPTVFRITQADVTIKNEGVSTCKFTLQMPPGGPTMTGAIQPPGL